MKRVSDFPRVWRLSLSILTAALTFAVSGTAMAAGTRCVDSLDEYGGNGSAENTACSETCDGGGACGLRDAMHDVYNGIADTVIFDPELTGAIAITGTVELFSSNAGTTSPLSILGPGSDRLTLMGDGTDRIFRIIDALGGALFDSNDVVISDLTLTGGKGAIHLEGGGGDSLTLRDAVILNNNASAESGGGVSADGPLTLVRTVVRQNHTNSNGGGIASTGPLEIEDSTIEGNVSANGGGGLNLNGGPVTIDGTTVSGNTAQNVASGIYAASSATGTITNSTISGNPGKEALYIANPAVDLALTNVTFSGNQENLYVGSGNVSLKNSIIANSNLPNCTVNTGSITSQGNNIASDDSCFLSQVTDKPSTDPKLGALADNGGLTRTHALIEGSPAIDTGDDATCPSTDQRGFARPADGDRDGAAACDIGSFETACGDGFVQAELGEECDDGNSNDNDDCANACTVAVCGDGIVGTDVEECDDAGESETCDIDCSAAACGDGLLNATAGEQCEDGNADNEDGCSDTCQFEDTGGDGGGCSLIR